MKRAKIMLIAIAVFATVGGALAFKAQKFGTQKYCFSFTNAIPQTGACTLKFTGTLASTAEEQDLIYYTTTENQNACALAQCLTSGYTTVEN